MKSGIYKVTYGARSMQGTGLIVVNGDSLNGGDPMYLIQGSLSQSGSSMSGTFSIKLWNKSPPAGMSPIFPGEHYSVPVTGTSSETSFNATGQGPGGVSITISGSHIADLV